MIKHLVLIAVLFTVVIGQYTGCDYQQNMVLGQTYDIFSPGYGTNQLYPSGRNCRWRAVAPANCFIRLNCFDMRLPQNNCVDRVEMSWTGTYNDPNPTYACSGQTFTYTTGNQLVVALRSQATGFAGGMFRCQIVAQQSTNGIIGTPIGVPIGK
ncbi:uncharacterized protein LOC119081992 [Bradysia coprophila]|uniref:uncharacterized protein LOC119081992 n=1 Tax=Bradysia coprophila TaxID=38358 RepID=UPI00187D9082|nr:uncharacterized protein LOC119081992 [Bradysia coprophila]